MEQGKRGFDRVRDAARWAETAHRRRPFAALVPALAVAIAGLAAAGAAEGTPPQRELAAVVVTAPATTERAEAPATTSPQTTAATATTVPPTTTTMAPPVTPTPEVTTPTTAPVVIVTGPPTPPPASAAPPVSADCTPGYDPCIVPGDDVDCESGNGDGPRRVRGPVYVEGDDPYGLDADGDGVACE